MTVKDFKNLYDDVIEAYKKDLKEDESRTHTIEFSIVQMFHLTERGPDSKYDISYYLVRNEKVRKALIEYFQGRPKLGGTEKIFKVLRNYSSDLSNPVVLSALKEFLAPKYLYTRVQKIKNEGDTVKVSNMKTVCRIAYNAYRAESRQTKFICYYYSTHLYQVKQFDLILDFPKKRAEVYHLHQDDPTEYSTEILELNKRLSVLNISLYKDGNPKNRRLYLLLHKPEKDIKDISILTGSFSGSSILDGSPICSKVIFINQNQSSNDIERNTLLAKRHLNLYRKRIKVVPESILRDPKEYKSKYDYELQSLEDFKGTHVIGRFDDTGGIVISILRFYNDYSITLEHPTIRSGKALRCMLTITSVFRRTMHIRVLAGRKDTPIVSFIASLAKEEGTFGDGAYCGITRNGIISGKVALYKQDSNPTSEEIGPQKFTLKQLENITEETIKKIISKLEPV